MGSPVALVISSPPIIGAKFSSLGVLSPSNKMNANSNSGPPVTATPIKKTLKRTKSVRACTTGEWEMHIDTEYDFPFYYNKATGASQWEKPDVAGLIMAEAKFKTEQAEAAAAAAGTPTAKNKKNE